MPHSHNAYLASVRFSSLLPPFTGFNTLFHKVLSFETRIFIWLCSLTVLKCRDLVLTDIFINNNVTIFYFLFFLHLCFFLYLSFTFFPNIYFFLDYNFILALKFLLFFPSLYFFNLLYFSLSICFSFPKLFFPLFKVNLFFFFHV